ncbi:MAG: lipoate--protein ligase family protein, partial [Planctomycetes bacterium]|nr:lipoate--protein ligase family protein [Planctomycetota bacterium]
MLFLDKTFSDPHENLAFDEALLLQAELGHLGECLRIWEIEEPAVVLGSGGIFHDDVKEEECLKSKVPILRRSSGGGTVLLGKGCLLFSLILRTDTRPGMATIKSSYVNIMEQIGGSLGISGITHDGTSDLAWDNKKFSGNAQQRKSVFILHHGSILYDFNISMIPKYLKHPIRQPEYRLDRVHEQFLTNLPMARSEIIARFKESWKATQNLQDPPIDLMKKLVQEK